MCFWIEQARCNLSFSTFFSLLFSISGVTVNKCQHCTRVTTHLVHEPSPLNWWMISCWQATGYYRGLKAKRNATALHNRCLFKSWENHPQRWGENTITVLTVLTHRVDVCNLLMIDDVQCWRQSKDACVPAYWHGRSKVGVHLQRQYFQVTKKRLEFQKKICI